MFKKIDNYHMKLEDWFITRNLVIDKQRYGLYQGNKSHGYFDSSAEAVEKRKFLINEAKGKK
jgi:hypothetical protein